MMTFLSVQETTRQTEKEKGRGEEGAQVLLSFLGDRTAPPSAH